MNQPATYISFADGRCRYLRANTVARQVEEAIMACDATQDEATLLDDKLAVVAHVKRDWQALNGFVVVSAVAAPAVPADNND
jgi:hypothetical protein